MKKLALILLIGLTITANGQSVENGKAIFDTNCKACHSIGKGRLVGPDLAGIMDKRDKEWIAQFILNSSELIASGDEQAKAIFEEYNKITMPAHPFSESEMEDLLAFMGSYEPEPVAEETTFPEELSTEEQVVEKAVAVPLWVKAFLSGTVVMAIVLLVVIGFLIKMIKGL
ncbi:MAG: c-type cytochrome [Candidatus Cyclobacteriaceae bacterium M2_1C_046]